MTDIDYYIAMITICLLIILAGVMFILLLQFILNIMSVVSMQSVGGLVCCYL